MVNVDLEFNTSGKFPTDSNFWTEYKSEFVAGDGITNGFKTVLGEQVFKPLGEVRTPFYNRFAGRPLNVGMAWKERALYKNKSKHFKPKATAQDALGYEDSEGFEVTHELNIEGWIKTTIPSSLKSIEMMIKDGEVGQLNSMLVDNVLKTYQADMESAIAKKLVSSIPNETDIDFTNGVNAWKEINRLAIEFMGEKKHYNMLTEEQNAKIRKTGGKILCFIDAITYENMISSFANLPSPEYLNKYAEFIPIMDGMPTPLKTTEWSAGANDGDTVITWTTKPKAIDKKQPQAILVTDTAVEYRPLMGGYKINLAQNEAGDFENQHLIWRGSIGISPFEDMIRLNQKTA